MKMEYSNMFSFFPSVQNAQQWKPERLSKHQFTDDQINSVVF